MIVLKIVVFDKLYFLIIEIFYGNFEFLRDFFFYFYVGLNFGLL